MTKGSGRRLAHWLTAVTLAAGAVVASTASPALADSGWKCTNIGNGEICLRTFKKDATHIRAADVYYHKFGGTGCKDVSLSHRIVGEQGNYLYPQKIWPDNGSFRICGYEIRSFAWTHAGAGAYVPAGGLIVGSVREVLTGNEYYSPPIYRSNM